MKPIAFTVDVPALIKEIARSHNTVGDAGLITGLSVMLGNLAEITIHAHRANNLQVIKVLDSMGFTRKYIGEDLMDTYGLQ